MTRKCNARKKTALTVTPTRRSERMSVFFTIRRRTPRFAKPAAPAVCAEVARRQFYLAKRRIIGWGTRPRSPHFWLNLLTTFCEVRLIRGSPTRQATLRTFFCAPWNKDLWRNAWRDSKPLSASPKIHTLPLRERTLYPYETKPHQSDCTSRRGRKSQVGIFD
jgi:hypothetical protein